VRSKPDVALYVLNNKRAHLRGIEDQFGVMIMIQSDGSLTGQQSFVIERGGIARQKPVTAAPRISPDSVSVEVGHEDESAEEMGEASFGGNVEEVSEPHPHEDRNGGDGGRRGGRRRRGRRGRGGGGQQREPMPAQNFGGNDSAESLSDGGENEFAPQNGQPSQGEARGPDGEPRKRRRRGRRGGRRNRNERNGRGEPSQAHPMEAHQSGSDFEAEGMPDTGPAPHSTAPQESAPANYEPSQEPSPVSESAPKRRSTVREPAPFVNFDQNGDSSASSSSASTAPEPETKGGGEIDSDRPRRSGWWSKLRGE